MIRGCRGRGTPGVLRGRRGGGGACRAGEGGAPVGLPEWLAGGAPAPPRVARRAASGCLGSGRAVTPHSRGAGPGYGRRQHEQHQERAGAGAEPEAGPQPGGRARAVRQDAGERGRGQGGRRRCGGPRCARPCADGCGFHGAGGAGDRKPRSSRGRASGMRTRPRCARPRGAWGASAFPGKLPALSARSHSILLSAG